MRKKGAAMRSLLRALPLGGLAIAVWLGALASAEAQPPLRIGASFSNTGAYAQLGQAVHRGQQLCVKHANDKGGVLGRKIHLTVEDDQSEVAKAVAIYERLIAQDKVAAVFSPYSSPITDAIANITEKHRMPVVACCAATTSIFKKGRKFIFMLSSPAEVNFEGFIDMSVKRGLKTIAVINEDTLFPRAWAQGTAELAKKRGLQVVLAEAYSKGTTDFSGILGRVKAANPDVLAAGTYFDDAVAITRQLKETNINPRMHGVTVGGQLLKFYEQLGRSAEFVYGSSQWEPELVTLRAGGLVPIARQYPGAREFVEAHRTEFPGADLSYETARGYGACQILLEGIRRAGTLDGEKIRDAILKMDLHTVFGAFKVDQDGLQIAHKTLMFQWQDGKKVIVWPEELAPGKPRFPTPPWTQRP
jgi:branched-chain amino acid transport system substrate-binding protein